MSIVLTFEKERETKRTWRYQEVVNGAPAEEPVLGNVYVQKTALDGIGNPDTLRVTIEEAK